MRKSVLLILCAVAGLRAADKVWPWAVSQSRDAVAILLLGDINIQQRANPADAFSNVSATLNGADLVYGNLLARGTDDARIKNQLMMHSLRTRPQGLGAIFTLLFCL